MRTWIGIGCSFAAAAFLGVLHFADADAVVQFCVGIVALALCVDPDEKALLIESRTDRCFSTPHYEGHPILLVRMDRMEPHELAELVEDAWLLRAPKRLVDGYLESAP